VTVHWQLNDEPLAAHVEPGPHTLPQAPQLVLVSSGVQEPLHTIWPDGQAWQRPDTQF
jgi:hypothetical protein